jgi:hypothetical protein
VSFHLDNNVPPTAGAITFTGDTCYRTITISCDLIDPEGDMLGVGARYSINDGVTWHAMTVSGDTSGITSKDYRSCELTWQAIDDLGFGEWDGVTIRLQPHDLDPGPETDSSPITVRNYAADWNGDGEAGAADWAALLRAFRTQDPACDIAPATGTVPYLVPFGDGVIDREDAQLFLAMWRWSLEHSAAAAGAARPEVQPVTGLSRTLRAAQHALEINEVTPLDPWQTDPSLLEFELRANEMPEIMAVNLTIEFDPTCQQYHDFDPGIFLGHDYGADPDQICFTHLDAEAGRLNVLMGRIDTIDPDRGGSGLLARLSFTRLTASGSPLDISYEVWDRNAVRLSGEEYASQASGIRLPETFELKPSLPNPFNGETTIRFQLPDTRRVQLHIYNIRGQRVATLVDREYPGGYHQVTWNGQSDDGLPLPSGVYIYLIKAGSARLSRKLTLIR